MALGLGFIGVLFIVTGIGGLLSRGDELWFSIAWTAVGVSFIAAAVVQAWKSRRR